MVRDRQGSSIRREGGCSQPGQGRFRGEQGAPSLWCKSPPLPGPPGEREGGKGKRPRGFSRVAARGMGSDGTGRQPTVTARPLGQLWSQSTDSAGDDRWGWIWTLPGTAARSLLRPEAPQALPSPPRGRADPCGAEQTPVGQSRPPWGSSAPHHSCRSSCQAPGVTQGVGGSRTPVCPICCLHGTPGPAGPHRAAPPSSTALPPPPC